MKYYLADNVNYSIWQFTHDNYNKFHTVYIATGYIDLPGLHEILPFFKEYQQVHILIGQEPSMKRYNINKVENDFPEFDIFNDLQDLEVDPKFLSTLELFRDLYNNKKLSIKIYKKTFLHAKCYIFLNHNESHRDAIGIVGSSNLTYNGIKENKNIELNHIEHNETVVLFNSNEKTGHILGHVEWFNKLWDSEDSEEWSGKFINILDESPQGDLMFTPYEMYIKTLYELYKTELDNDGEQQLDCRYKLFDYQIKNANSVVRKLHKNGVALLCDSVGLGKTITALEVIQRYKNKGLRVVVICPKSLENQWEEECRRHKIDIKILSLQNLDKINREMSFDKYSPVSLFVIDESHNLRTGSESKRYETIRGWIKQNKKSHVLMLTATPINNCLSDLLNQILLATGGDSNVLKFFSPNAKGLQNISDIIKSVIRSEGQGSKSPEIIKQKRAKLHPIIRNFVVKRTRYGILKEQELNQNSTLKFPKEQIKIKEYMFSKEVIQNIIATTVKQKNNKLPDNIIETIYSLPEIIGFSEDGNEKTIDDCFTYLLHPLDHIVHFDSIKRVDFSNSSPIRLIYQIIQFLGFIPYRFMLYHHQFYGKNVDGIILIRDENKNTLNRQRGLYGMLRVVFLKRLESSIYSLQKSIDNYLKILNSFETMLKNGIIGTITVIRESFADYADEIDKESFDIKDDTNSGFLLEDFNRDAMISDIAKEKFLLNVIKLQADILLKNDSKLNLLVHTFKDINQSAKTYPKILIFSYFADTIEYLQQEFTKHYEVDGNEIGFISGKNKNESEKLIKRFSPKSQKVVGDVEELRYLFATDVLSEGQNLQDCNVIINYDLHWNPVRMIQRNGRVNRIGSNHESVYIYNMYPNQELENYLKLVKRLESRITLIKDFIGLDQKVLHDEEEISPIEFIEDNILEVKNLYSNKAQETFDKINDDADLISDDIFITDLQIFDAKYKHDEAYKNKIYNIPLGKFGIVQQNNKLLSLIKLMHDSQFIGYNFVQLENNSTTIIDELIALNTLRVPESDYSRNKSQRYKLFTNFMNKKYLEDKIIVKLSSNTNARGLATDEENIRHKFLTRLISLRFDETQINSVDKFLLYSNDLDFNNIKKMIKKYNNTSDSHICKEILHICDTHKHSEYNIISPNKCIGVLYYEV